jgi:hypothetical protein
MEPYQFAVCCAIFFVAVQLVSSLVSPLLMPSLSQVDESKLEGLTGEAERKKRKELLRLKRVDHDERICSTIHAVLLFQGSLRVVLSLPQNGAYLPLLFLNSPQDLSSLPTTPLDPMNTGRALATLYMSFAVGYFIWDLIGCARDFKRLGLAFTIHAFFGVIGIGLPLVDQDTPNGIFYFGCALFLFELSTPFLNVRTFLINAGASAGVVMAANVTFALTFLLSRIIYGIPLCLSFSGYAYSVPGIKNENKLIWTLAPFASMCLNIMWFYGIVQMALRGGGKKKKN